MKWSDWVAVAKEFGLPIEVVNAAFQNEPVPTRLTARVLGILGFKWAEIYMEKFEQWQRSGAPRSGMVPDASVYIFKQQVENPELFSKPILDGLER